MKLFVTAGFRAALDVASAIHDHLMRHGILVWYDYPIRDETSRSLSDQLAAFFNDSDFVVIIVTSASIGLGGQDGFGGRFFHDGELPAALKTTTPVLVVAISVSLPNELEQSSNITIAKCTDADAVPEVVLAYVQGRTRHEVFISYAREDSEAANDTSTRLRIALSKPWIDRSSLRQGDQFPTRILEAIDRCDHFLLLWSAAARQSRWVEREWNYAYKTGRSILPLILDQTPLPMALEGTHAFAGQSDPLFDSFFRTPATK